LCTKTRICNCFAACACCTVLSALLMLQVIHRCTECRPRHVSYAVGMHIYVTTQDIRLTYTAQLSRILLCMHVLLSAHLPAAGKSQSNSVLTMCYRRIGVALWNVVEFARNHRHGCCITTRLHRLLCTPQAKLYKCHSKIKVYLFDGSVPDCSIHCTLCPAATLERRPLVNFTCYMYSFD